mmetsp:Transcript_26579/g.49344  ORF Transcript_26579/g.49344 Transcript_26579/m.49344 type:complete len:87 (+) Transcript_26579:42-302(+)
MLQPGIVVLTSPCISEVDTYEAAEQFDRSFMYVRWAVLRIMGSEAMMDTERQKSGGQQMGLITAFDDGDGDGWGRVAGEALLVSDR